MTATQESTYRPFANVDEFVSESSKHGNWLKYKTIPADTKNRKYISHALPTLINSDGVHFILRDIFVTFNYEELFDKFVWANDNSPVGVIINNQ